MKKKRFIRLIMAHRIQQREAERMAQNVAAYGSYERLFEHYRVMLAFCPLRASFRGFEKAVSSAAGTLETFKAAYVGVDMASGADYSGHLQGYKTRGVIFDEMAEYVRAQRVTHEEHKERHAAAKRSDIFSALAYSTAAHKTAYRCAELEQQEAKLRVVCGHSVEQLTELFLRGFTLEAPIYERLEATTK